MSPAGHERVVVARSASSFVWATNASPPGNSLAVAAFALSPATLTAPPKVLVPTLTGVGGVLAADPALQVFAGQSDAVDRSHFTLAYQVGDKRGHIDGWLQDDDTVKLQFRDGPAWVGIIREIP